MTRRLIVILFAVGLACVVGLILAGRWIAKDSALPEPTSLTLEEQTPVYDPDAPALSFDEVCEFLEGKANNPNPRADVSSPAKTLNEWARLVGEAYDAAVKKAPRDVAVIAAHETIIDRIAGGPDYAYMRAAVKRFLSDFPSGAQRPDSLLARSGRLTPDQVGAQIRLPNGDTHRIPHNTLFQAVYKRRAVLTEEGRREAAELKKRQAALRSSGNSRELAEVNAELLHLEAPPLINYRWMILTAGRRDHPDIQQVEKDFGVMENAGGR